MQPRGATCGHREGAGARDGGRRAAFSWGFFWLLNLFRDDLKTAVLKGLALQAEKSFNLDGAPPSCACLHEVIANCGARMQFWRREKTVEITGNEHSLHFPASIEAAL